MTKLMPLSLALVVTIVSCSSDPRPEDVARSLYQLAELARQNGFAGPEQSAMFSLLSKDSQKLLVTCGVKHGPDDEGARRFSPANCLIFDSYLGLRNDFTTERVADGPNRVRLEITSNNTTAIMELLFEDGWKIDLPTTVQLNKAPDS